MVRSRLKPGWLVFFGLLAVACVAGAVLIWRLPHEARDEAVFLPVASAICATFALTSALLLLIRVDFDEEWISVRSGLRTFSMRRARVIGRRLKRYQHGVGEVLLFSEVASEKPLRIPTMIALQRPVLEWLAQVPDLDAQELQVEVQKLIVEQGETSLLRRYRIAKGLNAAGIGVGLWVLFYPRPYRLALSADALVFSVAWVVAFAGRGAYQLERERKDPRPALGAALIVPAAALALRAMLDLHVISLVPALAPVLVGGALLAAVLIVRDARERHRPWRLLLWMPLHCAFCFGAMLFANAALDRSKPQVFAVEVLQKSVVRDQRTSYRVRLAPWGPRREANDEDIPRATFERLPAKGEVRVLLYSGRLGLPWFVIAAP